jgi:hypothetical protein
LIISDTEKEIMRDAEAALVTAGCPNVASLLIQRGVGLHLLKLSREDWRVEQRKIKAFVDEAHIVQS